MIFEYEELIIDEKMKREMGGKSSLCIIFLIFQLSVSNNAIIVKDFWPSSKASQQRANIDIKEAAVNTVIPIVFWRAPSPMIEPIASLSPSSWW